MIDSTYYRNKNDQLWGAVQTKYEEDFGKILAI